MDREYLRQIVSDQLLEFKQKEFGVRRKLSIDINEHFNSPEISVITGVRRCGKSTLLQQLSEQLPKDSVVYFLDLESPFLDEVSIKDLELIYNLWQELDPPNERKIFIFFDEIQNVLNWEKWVRFLAAKKKHKVFISGSNSQMLSSELGSALTGRHLTIHLTPFSLQEVAEDILKLSSLDPVERSSSKIRIELNRILDRILKVGVFPRTFLEQSSTLLPLYFNDILTRDILKRHKVRHTVALLRLGELLCRENTRIFNKTKTSDLLGIKDNMTMGKFCEYFKETYLFDEIRAYSPSLRKRLRSYSKFYCVDPALPKYILQPPSIGYSPSFENLVYIELKKFIKEIFYWHSKESYEVDFVGLYKNQLIAVQASYSVRDKETLQREIKGLASANKELNCQKLIIITADESFQDLDNSPVIVVIPISRFCNPLEMEEILG